jgi:hypothetical protein
MHRHPTQGIAGSKPRIPKSDVADDSKAKKARISKLSEEYLRTRTEHQHVKLLAAQMELAARRGELLSRKLAEIQLAYLLVCMRRQLLSFPGVLAGQLAGLSDVHKIRMVLEGDCSKSFKATAPGARAALSSRATRRRLPLMRPTVFIAAKPTCRRNRDRAFLDMLDAIEEFKRGYTYRRFRRASLSALPARARGVRLGRPQLLTVRPCSGCGPAEWPVGASQRS